MNLREVTDKLGDGFVAAVDAELLRLANEKPDFIYRLRGTSKGACSYDGPCRNIYNAELLGPECDGCIFGQALKRLGWNDEEELAAEMQINSLVNYYVNGRTSALPSDNCPDYWRDIQISQDKGHSWGLAISILKGLDHA